MSLWASIQLYLKHPGALENTWALGPPLEYEAQHQDSGWDEPLKEGTELTPPGGHQNQVPRVCPSRDIPMAPGFHGL